MKKLYEYTKQEIVLVCKGMELYDKNGTTGPFYIHNFHTEVDASWQHEPALFLSKDKISNYASWYGENSYKSTKPELLLACEIALDAYFNPKHIKPRSRFELIED